MMTRSGLGLVLALAVAASWMLAGLAAAAEPFTVLLIAPAGVMRSRVEYNAERVRAGKWVDLSSK